MADTAKNFSRVTLAGGYDAAAVSVVLQSGHGARLPTVPFNLVWWNSTDYANPGSDPNVEIVRCTARNTDTLTVIRAQEGTSAATHNTGGKTYEMIAGLTADVINTQLEQVSRKNQPNGYAGLSAGSKLAGTQQTYGTTANTATEGNDARIVGAEQTANKNAASGYAGLTNSRVLKANSAQVIQLVSAEYAGWITSTAVFPNDDTVPQNSEGVEIVNVSITPRFADSKILIWGSVGGCQMSAGGRLGLGLFKDSVGDALASAWESVNGAGENLNPSLMYQENAGSTNAKTYRLRVGSSSAGITWGLNGSTTVRIYGGCCATRLYVMEIATI